tara:strand:- start:1178 stop:1642 length:465 start_codon:yes stop_codon:yes gene_type:complete
MKNKKEEKHIVQDPEVKNKKTIFDYQQDYYYFSGEASKLNRQLILASIAVIWLFHVSDNIQSSIPEALLGVLYCLFASLALDLLQYFFGSAIWSLFFFYLDKKAGKGKISFDEDIEAPIILPVIINCFFWLKLIVGLIAYIKLLVYLKNHIGTY